MNLATLQNKLRRLDSNGWLTLTDAEQNDCAVLEAAIAQLETENTVTFTAQRQHISIADAVPQSNLLVSRISTP